MVSRLLLVAVIALLPFRCGADDAGISRPDAVEAARAYVVRADYGGDGPLFYRNTGNAPTIVRQTVDRAGDRWWFVRFDDFQAMQRHCVKVRRASDVVAEGTAC